MTTSLIFVFFLFLIYNYFSQQNHSKSIFAENCPMKKLILTSILNFTVMIGFVLNNSPYYEFAAMIGYLVLIFIEMRALYNSDNFSAYFSAISTVLNLFSVRILITAIYMLITDMSRFDTHVNFNAKVVITGISFLMCVPFVYFSSKSINKKLLDVIRTDRKNLLFSSIIMTLLFVYLSVINVVYSHDIGNPVVALIILRVGIGVLITHILSFSYTYIFATLQLNAIKCEQLSHIVAVEERSVRELKETASTDKFTGLKLRSTAEDVINIYLKQGRHFFVLLFDMDGLKRANDEYGHEEGDFYILNVAKTLSVIFDIDTVARVGGDEFLVVGSAGNEYDYMKKSVQCNMEITQLKARYNKPYDTSVSYGIVHVGVDKVTNFKEIYTLADQRMYTFKKQNKKERR